MTWILGLVALALVVVGGGYLLVRWGTPSGGPTVASVEDAPAESSPAATGTAPPRAAEPGSRGRDRAPPGGDAASEGRHAAGARAVRGAGGSAAPERPAAGAGRAAPPPRPARRRPRARRRRRPPTPRPGRLLVRSNPAGAEVFVNGTRRGVTPLALRDLPLGGYDLRVNRAGFTRGRSSA